MLKNKLNWILLFTLFASMNVYAKENIGITGKRLNTYAKLTAGCSDATTQVDLDINNVRCRLLGAGDFGGICKMMPNMKFQRLTLPQELFL